MDRRKRVHLTLVAGGVFYTGAILYAMFFFKERSLGDSSWQIFQLVNTGRPVVSHLRWLTVFNQLPAWLGVYLKGELLTITKLYAVGPQVFAAMLFILSVLVLRCWVTALSIVFVSVFSVGTIFFEYPDLEMYLFAVLFCFSAFLLASDKWKLNWKWVLITMPPVFFMVSSHPMAWSVLMMLPLFLVIEKKYAAGAVTGIWAILFIGLAVGGLDVYQAVSFTERLHMDSALTVDEYLSMFVDNLSLWIVLVMVILGLIRTRRMVLLAIVMVFSSVYAFVAITRVDFSQTDLYLMPYGGLLVFLLFYLVKQLKPNKLVLAIVFGIFSLDIGEILLASPEATRNVTALEAMVNHALENNARRAAVANSAIPDHMEVNSFMYTETALLSSMGDKGMTTICVPFSETEDLIDKIQAYIPQDQYARFFVHCAPKDTACKLDMIDVVYQEEYLELEYFEKELKMWFHDELNQDYFYQGKGGFQLVY